MYFLGLFINKGWADQKRPVKNESLFLIQQKLAKILFYSNIEKKNYIGPLATGGDR